LINNISDDFDENNKNNLNNEEINTNEEKLMEVSEYYKK